MLVLDLENDIFLIDVDFLYINKLYIISKCIKVYEESHIAMKQSFLIVIKF